MTRLPLLAVIPPVAFLGLAALVYAGMQRDDPDALPSTFIGEPAPDLAAAPFGDFGGFDRAALDRDGVKLVNFWASWCTPCRVEHPALEALAEDGIPIYGVNFKDVEANALRFLDELGNPYVNVGADDDGRIARDWGVYGVPETYVIDGQGRVIERLAGPITQRTLEGKIMPAIDAVRAD